MNNKNIPKQIIGIFLLFFLCSYYPSLCLSNTGSENRYIFIDGGAHLGETIKAFKKSSLYKAFKSNLYPERQWKIIAFECNPYLVNRIPKSKDVTVISKAMWIHDKGLEFYFGKTSQGGNVVNNQYTAEKKESIHVESLDFGQWLRNNFKLEDIIYVKLDIEGAEYTILEKMLEDGSIEYIDRLYVEFHSIIMADISEDKDKELISKIKKLGISVITKAPGTKKGEYFQKNP